MSGSEDRWFVLAHYPGPRWDEPVPFREQQGIGDHIAFMRSLADRGLLALGGPFAEAVGPADQVGMAIIRAADPTEAEALAAEDESVRGGLLRVRVREWLPKMGSALT